MPRGTPKDNFSPDKDGNYSITTTCSCGNSYTGKSKRSVANARTGANQQRNKCERSHLNLKR